MTLVLLGDGPPQLMRRVPQGMTRRENDLRDLLFDHPAILPLGEIDPSIGAVASVARELNIPEVGRIDALLADGCGRLVIVECKLWRNPQARREVVGQILDYARALARFSYDDLQREVSSATGRKGNALYEIVRDLPGTLDEARFVDQVARNLAGGRFTLLVVGDGITEGTQRIGAFLRAQPGLAFDFALIEMAEYRFTDPASGVSRLIVQPRVLARTVVIERAVIRNEAGSLVIDDLRPESTGPGPRETRIDPEAQQQWRAFAERFIAGLQFDDPGQPPPRIGGFGWMRVPLPPPAALTLWRSRPQELAGAFVRLSGSDGLSVHDRLAADREAIDAEFVAAGLAAPVWERGETEAALRLSWPAPWPWDPAAEDAQADRLGRAANRFVNSLAPRLTHTGAAA
ncbi:hypothetical protein BSL82_08420 [Tardibacter chloracetimidivorans]|uniref:DUF4268 domain-containing protein n=1 Tax=Tardibacter chloracetimidivorans TaxID=1921510 RepID=A0A1L3ZUM2_9SPHN|nr:hypothetical protein [Tardibacter chloracetimidivorans]API59331.1 hypothetical protein BSL82_08420 [Tardibacter chloracetimidivorans]